jgi:hypothetical protein
VWLVHLGRTRSMWKSLRTVLRGTGITSSRSKMRCYFGPWRSCRTTGPGWRFQLKPCTQRLREYCRREPSLTPSKESDLVARRL